MGPGQDYDLSRASGLGPPPTICEPNVTWRGQMGPDSRQLAPQLGPSSRRRRLTRAASAPGKRQSRHLSMASSQWILIGASTGSTPEDIHPRRRLPSRESDRSSNLAKRTMSLSKLRSSMVPPSEPRGPSRLCSAVEQPVSHHRDCAFEVRDSRPNRHLGDKKIHRTIGQPSTRCVR